MGGFTLPPRVSSGRGLALQRRHPRAERRPHARRVLDALAAQDPAPAEVIVVDDGSTDETAGDRGRAAAPGCVDDGRRPVRGRRAQRGLGGGGRRRRSSSSTPTPSRARAGARGSARAATRVPGRDRRLRAHVRGATRRGAGSRHLQVETPYLPRGEPRDVPFVSSYCMVVPRGAPLRWDESYGGEDALFCADALAAGLRLVFDPRFHAAHEHDRRTFARPAQPAAAAGLRPRARGARSSARPRTSGSLSRVPLHYFVLLRLPVVYRRLDSRPGAARAASSRCCRGSWSPSGRSGRARSATRGGGRPCAEAAAAVRVSGRPPSSSPGRTGRERPGSGRCSRSRPGSATSTSRSTRARAAGISSAPFDRSSRS